MPDGATRDGVHERGSITWSAAPFVPESSSVAELAVAARLCHGCPLWETATQTVFGEGDGSGALMLIGEQPGDQEDRQGHPFVGPAGRVLWQCVEAAGISREEIHVTNAVKHFKHEVLGKRRLHKKPGTGENEACHPWLEAELRAVAPAAVVVLGATAVRSVFGRTMAIGTDRDNRFDVLDVPTLVTYRPSAALRADEKSFEIKAALSDDLRVAHQWSRHRSGSSRRQDAPSLAENGRIEG